MLMNKLVIVGYKAEYFSAFHSNSLYMKLCLTSGPVPYLVYRGNLSERYLPFILYKGLYHVYYFYTN